MVARLHLICDLTGYGKSLLYRYWPSLCSLLAKEGYQQGLDDAIVLVISPLLDPILLVSHITFVVAPPVRLFPVETNSM